jgi:NAD+ kinase
VSTSERAAARKIERVVVRTHRRPEETSRAVELLIAAAERNGVELRLDREEAEKHGLDGFGTDSSDNDRGPREDLCIVLGGDGTTLRSLRAYAGSDVPVFSVNCGRIGFLATVDRPEIEEGLERALSGRFEVMKLPALLLELEGGHEFAVNEVSFQRGSNMNVAHLSYSLADEKVARAPCDGLIAATPAGSTGYNLSAGGPILAWGVHGYVVTMVAPHALSTRSLVAAPGDVLVVTNDGDEAVDVVIDGIRAGEVSPSGRHEVRFRHDAVGLAQLPGTSFYSRFREKLRLLTS